jgi:hypothetical protein
VPKGSMASAQQPVPLKDGKHALIADYTLGIGKIDLVNKSVTWLPHPDIVAVNGIDGLYRSGNRLLALENGTKPIRVMEYQLDEKSSRITGARVLEQNTAHLTEPTHGVVAGSEFYYIANSGSSKLESGGRVKAGEKLERARIQKLSLRHGMR